MSQSEEMGIIYLDPEWKIFDEIVDSDSDVSIISDPFSIASVNIATNPKKFADVDLLKRINFSAPLRSILDKHLNDDIKTMMFEALDQIRKRNMFTQVKKKVPLVAQIKIVNLLNSTNMNFGEITEEVDNFIPDEKKTWEDLKDEVLGSRNILKNIRRLTEKERSRKLLQEKTNLEAYETMSGYWRLLGNYNDFQISPPGFNSYQTTRGHWLQAEPIPTDVLFSSRNKVLTWFNKYFPRTHDISK